MCCAPPPPDLTVDLDCAQRTLYHCHNKIPTLPCISQRDSPATRSLHLHAACAPCVIKHHSPAICTQLLDALCHEACDISMA